MWSWRGQARMKPAKGEESFTFLGQGTTLKGIISCEGMLRIDGRVEGEVHTKGAVVVGEHAVVEGDVWAESVTSSGAITGNITASDKVQLQAPAVMLGKVKAAIVSIEEGVAFRGTCESQGQGEMRSLEVPDESLDDAGVARVMGD